MSSGDRCQGKECPLGFSRDSCPHLTAHCRHLSRLTLVYMLPPMEAPAKPKKQILSVYLTPEILDRLGAQAEKENRSLSNQALLFIQRGLEAEGAK